jgi:hypothetical protein
MSCEDLYEDMATKIDSEAGAAKHQLRLFGDAPQELLLAIEAYAANLKQAAINKLQVRCCMGCSTETQLRHSCSTETPIWLHM